MDQKLMFKLVITRHLNSNSSIQPVSDWSKEEQSIAKFFNGQIDYFISIKGYDKSYTANDSVTVLTYSNIPSLDDVRSLNDFRDPNTSITDIKKNYYTLLRSKNVNNYDRVTKEIYENDTLVELLEDKSF